MEITARVWEGTDYLPHVFDRWLADPASTFEVAEEQGTVVAFHRMRPMMAGIVLYEGLRVAEEHRRRGIARAMLAHGIEEARDQGFREMRVITGNPAACRLFESEGFQRLVHCTVWLSGRVEGPDLPRLGSAEAVSSSDMPFLKALMPFAMSPIISEILPRPPNTSSMTTPTMTQCQILKPPMVFLRFFRT